MDADEARARFSGSRVAHLATADAMGRPHLVPCTFAVAGDLIYTAVDHKPKTTRHLRRLRNIRENPQVSLLADHYEEDWDRLWWVRADGRARILDDEAGEDADQVRRAALALLARRYEQYRDRPPEGPVIEIAVARWSGWVASRPRRR
ncbi:PPOX class F420-dependent oxidoreductase [Thermopolyspora flexuosa]|jgi:PPOX class probable F420-dependent enzyme|uniref:PPOX class probable F420-dependent enzyme n=1 Tax=Thermopolyspora flexuosa TaxID=103836 RepID=A0A543J3S2_9ACTN|nr:TIGR03668 family PPOX class F420-dependent oxidoreductase [Thermopolyspora flexuosa]TQM77471.1 PPOX class probable F420-dependent enzyme [Thermopolyspora flexuosa]GGM73099.1 PPOX class F420-dependent oxidoreductase [Thermopolyspora flexuosa]